MPQIRVIVWTTGNVGRYGVRLMAEHPVLELVGVYAHSKDKVGRDAGELCGIDPVGVVATDDVDELLALGADCVFYVPLFPDYDVVCRILASGANIVTTAAFINGRHLDDAVRARIEDACRAGGSSMAGTGTNPGFINVAALLCTQLCGRVDEVTVLESVDCTFYDSPETWAATGMGLPGGDPRAAELAEANSQVFKDAVSMMGDALGVELDEIRFDVEFALATQETKAGGIVIPPGCTTGLKGSWVGAAAGRDVIRLQLVWKLGTTMEPDWPLYEGYQVTIKGDPDVAASVRFPAGSITSIEQGLGVTAMPGVNSIPHVVAAPPGIVDIATLPTVAAFHAPCGEGWSPGPPGDHRTTYAARRRWKNVR